MKNIKKAFTLVELIVVITILAILGTIAFLSLQGYSSNARDGVRTSDLKNIEKGLGVMLVKSGIVPTPDDTKINITASGTLIGIQGYAGKLVQSQLAMSKDSGKDPLDGAYYTYSTNASKTQYQLLGFLEGSVSNNILGNSYAVDYSQRNIVTRGQELGILLGASGTTLNQPAQEFNSGNFETFSGTTNFKTVFTQSNSVTSSGITLAGILFKTDECKQGMTEISLSNGQTWSCINLGATTVWDGITQPNDCLSSSTNCNSGNTYIGDYYQWGRNNTGFTNAPSYPYDWQTQNDDSWGSITNTNIARQGPCPSGWHVPSQEDWQLACNNILGYNCFNGMSYNPTISTKLRLPFSGSRFTTNGVYLAQGSIAFYYSSDPGISQYYNKHFYINNSTKTISPNRGTNRGNAYPVRCLKN